MGAFVVMVLYRNGRRGDSRSRPGEMSETEDVFAGERCSSTFYTVGVRKETQCPLMQQQDGKEMLVVVGPFVLNPEGQRCDNPRSEIVTAQPRSYLGDNQMRRLELCAGTKEEGI